MILQSSFCNKINFIGFLQICSNIYVKKRGTILVKIILGSKLSYITCGFQGFHRNILKKLINHKFWSIGCVYQTKLRYLFSVYRIAKVPFHYSDPSENLNSQSIINSLSILAWLFNKRIFKDFGGKL